MTLYSKGDFDMVLATTLVEAFDAFTELKAEGGAKLQRELLDSILADQETWWTYQLNAVIDCSREVSIWNTDDESILKQKIAHYMDDGLSDESSNCDGADDYSRLREGLSTLGEKLDVSFDSELNDIEQKLAELEPRYSSEDYRRGPVNSVSRNFDGKESSVEAIREVFATLLD
jgi:hypothetical protein